MAFKTSTFSGWQLSGKHARAFLKQIKENEGKPNLLAQAAYERGRLLMAEYEQKGCFTLVLNKKVRKKTAKKKCKIVN
jgi:hypothetical protein